MKKVLGAAVAAAVLTWPAAASAADRFDVYVGDVPRERLADLVELGVDRHEIELKAASGRGKDAAVRVEVIITATRRPRCTARASSWSRRRSAARPSPSARPRSPPTASKCSGPTRAKMA